MTIKAFISNIRAKFLLQPQALKSTQEDRPELRNLRKYIRVLKSYINPKIITGKICHSSIIKTHNRASQVKIKNYSNRPTQQKRNEEVLLKIRKRINRKQWKSSRSRISFDSNNRQAKSPISEP